MSSNREGADGDRRPIEGLGTGDAGEAPGAVSETHEADTLQLGGGSVLERGSILDEGDRLGAYSIEREINRGGMGVVYLAHRADETFDLRVAIKTIAVPGRPILTDRFESERRILARLRHPNIVQILDGGTAPGGVPYLVMEHVEGEPLDAYCDRRRLSTEERLQLFLEVCDGVDHAHRNLVVHRDLKPSNILVTGEGTVKLLDFGIAKLLDDDGQTRASTVTISGGAALTPEYASPEQIRHEPATTSSDVYSLGMVLYELLTGVRAYQLTDYAPQTLFQVVCETDVVPPSRMVRRETASPAAEARATTPSKLARRLVGDLDNIVLMALRKEPERRYHSVSALAADVRSHLSGEPVRARPLTFSYLAGRYVLRHRGKVLAVSLVVLSLLVGGVATMGQFLRASREAERAAVEAARTQKIGEFLDSLLTTPDPIRGISKDATLADLVDYAIVRLERDFAGEPGIRGSLRRTLARTYLNLGRVEEARDQLDTAIAEHQQAYGAGHVETLRSERTMAVYEDAIGASEEALARLEGVIAALESRTDQPEELGLAYELRCSALSSLGRNEEALSYCRRAISILEKLEGAEYEASQAFNNLAVVFMNSGDFARAVETLEEGLVRSRAVQERPYPLQARMHANLGLAHKEQGHSEDAQRHLASAVEMLSDLLGSGHPETLLARIALSEQLLAEARGLPAADREMEDVLAAAMASLPPEHYLIPYAQTVRAKILIALGRGSAAEALCRSAILARRESLPEGHWLIASAELTLGKSLLRQGKREEAKGVLLGAYRVLEEQRGADFSKTVEAKALLEPLGVELGS